MHLRSRWLLLALLSPWFTHGTALAHDSACDSSDACRIQGRCSDDDGHCVAAVDQDCFASDFCRYGKCRARAGRCIAASQQDCQRSWVCRQRGWCTLREGSCQPALVPTWEEPDDSGDGALKGAGIALTAVGGLSVVAGALLLFQNLGEAMACDAHVTQDCDRDFSAAGPILMGGGLAGVGLGIPLIVLGARGDNPPDEGEMGLGMSFTPTAQSVGLVVSF